MENKKRKRLESRGWEFGDAQDFLGLSGEEAAYIELKISLSQSLRRRRQAKRLTQIQLAKMIGSSQSHVAKMEAGDPSVSLDLLVRSHLALGATQKDLARAISSSKVSPAN